ncbi:30S ribosomal protein S6 [Rickettsiales endosymbiont of Stachyamoeba lipophora]|uniref:30S ribosomal protein S6 n=1 Tax=Rickettsiales endosymbiont of Stachyamoeba lipophora TaxID=2486578 RepID=UPI000F645362|nr:30S ribosomal protein S6 [Rickettsiales endosymbiont of Stachyamoeba lipophora]AZL15472.1 30S ribosomal protein S6 [Rickettsiales endosymbiont of Stachyamoeba lipophora]
MSLYETTFIARQDISSNEVEKIAEKYISIIEEMGGKLVKKEYWGLKNLAYLIKKGRKGHYMFLGLEAPSNAMDEIRRLMSINEDILREVTIKVESISDEPSEVMAMKKTGSTPESESKDSEE